MTTSPAPYEEPQGYRSAPGYVKTRPENNDHYVSQFVDHPWYPIIAATHYLLTQVAPGYNIAQIKEKFGLLRYYITFPTPVDPATAELVQTIIRSAETWVEYFEYARRNPIDP